MKAATSVPSDPSKNKSTSMSMNQNTQESWLMNEFGPHLGRNLTYIRVLTIAIGLSAGCKVESDHMCAYEMQSSVCGLADILEKSPRFHYYIRIIFIGSKYPK